MDNKITFNTGYTLEFRPISRVKIAKINAAVEKEFRDRGEPLDPPRYYTVEPTKEHPEGLSEPHNETTLMTDEDKENWAKHQLAVKELVEEQSVRACRYLLLNGILTDITPSKKWLNEQKELGIELPDDKDSIKLEYLYEEILVSEKNSLRATFYPLILGEEKYVSSTGVEATEDTFRGNVESGQTANINQVTDEGPGESAKE